MQKPLPIIKVVKLAYLAPLAVLMVAFSVLATYFAYSKGLADVKSRASSLTPTASLVSAYPLISKNHELLSYELEGRFSLRSGESLVVTDLSDKVFYKDSGPELSVLQLSVSKMLNFFTDKIKVSTTVPVVLQRSSRVDESTVSDIQNAAEGVNVGQIHFESEISPVFLSALVPRIAAFSLLLLCALLSYFYIRRVGQKITSALGALVEKNEWLESREYDKAMIDHKLPNISEIQLLAEHHNAVVSKMKLYDMSMQDEVTKVTAKIHRQNRHLEEASSKLVSMNQRKTEFMKAISHDLRNPLSSVKLSAEMLSKHTENRNMAMLAQQILTSCGSMVHIIEDLTESGMMDHDWFSTTLSEVDVISLADQVINQFHQMAAQKGVDLFLMPCKNLNSVIMTDHRIVTRIINSLVGYSLKQCQYGCITVSVKTEEDDEGRGSLVLEVNDSSKGLNGEDVDQEGLSTCVAEREKTSNYSSQMLNLGFIRQMISTLDGDLKVITREEFGTSFIAKLPVDLIARYSETQNEIRHDFAGLSLRIGILEDGTPFSEALASFLCLHNVQTNIISKRGLMNDKEDINDLNLVIGYKLSSMPSVVSKLHENNVEVASMESLQAGDHMDTLQKTMKIDHPVMIHTSFFSIIRLLTSIEQTRGVTSLRSGQRHLERAIVNPLGDILGGKMAGPLSGYSVLVIDDNAEFTNALRVLIESSDGECFVASDVDSLPEDDIMKTIDLIIIDYEVSSGRGFSCAKMIKELYGEDAPKMICITGHVVLSESLEALAMERVFTFVVNKPLPESDDTIDLMLRALHNNDN